MKEKYVLNATERDCLVQALCLQLNELKVLYDITQRREVQFPFRSMTAQTSMGFQLQRSIEENKQVLQLLGAFVNITITPKPRPGGASSDG